MIKIPVPGIQLLKLLSSTKGCLSYANEITDRWELLGSLGIGAGCQGPSNVMGGLGLSASPPASQKGRVTEGLVDHKSPGIANHA